MVAGGAAAAAHGVALVVYLHLFGRAINSLHGRHIDQLFNDIKQDQKCIICRQYVYLSTVSYSYRFSYVCLEHWKHLCECNPKKFRLLHRHTLSERSNATAIGLLSRNQASWRMQMLCLYWMTLMTVVCRISMSMAGNLDHGSPRPGDGEDSAVKATNSDVGGDHIGAQPGEVDGEKLPISEESIMPQDSSQRDIADDGTNQVGVHQEVQMDSVHRTSSSDSKETMEVPIPSLDLRVDNANMGEEGTREMEVGVSGRSSDGNIQDVEPTVSGETGMEVGLEAAMGLAASQEIPGRGDTNDEANGVAKEAVQEDADTHELDLSVQKVDSALCGDAVSQCFMPYRLDEYIQRHLYVTTLSRDLLQLQLDEGTYLNSDVTLSSDEILKRQVQLKESEESEVAAHEEIQQCRHELTNLNIVKGELEFIVASLKQEIDASNNKCEQLEIELQSSKENAQQILSELADCQSLLEGLQKENIELTENLALEEKTRKQVEAQQEHLSGYVGAPHPPTYSQPAVAIPKEEKLKRDIQWKISISENKDSKIKDYSWVINGLNRLFRSRRVLSYSYPFAFYMFGDEIFKDEMTPEERELKQNLFEDQQQQLEFNVDRLSGFLEKDFQNFSDEEVMDTMKHVINLSNVVDRLCKQMYQCIDNDLLYPLCMPHNIAPYKSKGLDRASELHISLDSAEQSSPSMKCRQDEDKSQPGLCSESGSSLTGNRPILQLHGASSDNNGRRSHKRERRDAYGGGALFDLNVPAEVADKI
ncbi:hypothetical protein ZWY2020_035688 [Hordeum vulgare]|nr:hypothetical protein ZWY2020_035688 [Hordeum vulgare]